MAPNRVDDSMTFFVGARSDPPPVDSSLRRRTTITAAAAPYHAFFAAAAKKRVTYIFFVKSARQRVVISGSLDLNRRKPGRAGRGPFIGLLSLSRKRDLKGKKVGSTPSQAPGFIIRRIYQYVGPIDTGTEDHMGFYNVCAFFVFGERTNAAYGIYSAN